MPLSKQRKSEYFEKMNTLLDTYSKVFVVQVDNVTSRQMQQTRHAMRDQAEVCVCLFEVYVYVRICVALIVCSRAVLCGLVLLCRRF